MWLVMAALLMYFAYFKGWIFADFENISPLDAHTLLQKSNNIILVDVRSKESFEKDHLAKAISVPIENLDSFFSHQSLRLRSVNDGKKLLVYSERGEVSGEASRLLAKRDFEVLNLEGGVVFWIRAGYALRQAQ
jgi:rhodanese-related sulfurtransferase